jgi:alkanesulfonate monooxygenase SsuD/methylene tetrahydromethanopterin reductase-like flavin-dependent oxidoreductase (luciferase family)
MKAGLFLPIFDELARPALLADLAAEAEEAGWDGVFVWDHIYYRDPIEVVTDPWISLAAMARSTTKVALGPMVTPLARRRPQVVARQLAALDDLSRGRIIFGVGLGLDSSGGEFARFGEEQDGPTRSAIYDEALQLVGDLLSGQSVQHDGAYFKAMDVRFLPRPVQSHLPIWVGATWPHRRPLDRAARHDGVFVLGVQPRDVRDVCRYVESIRPGGLAGFDIAVQDSADGDPQAWKEAGATWWMAAFDPFRVTAADVRAAIRRLPDL